MPGTDKKGERPRKKSMKIPDYSREKKEKCLHSYNSEASKYTVTKYMVI